MDNSPRPLRDVLANAYNLTYDDDVEEFTADGDCERLGLTNAVVVPDLAAHDAAEREALRDKIETCVCEAYSSARVEPTRPVMRYARRLANAILGPAPHIAPQAHEGDS